MPIADGTSASDETRRFGSNFLQAMHQARRRQAMQLIVDYQDLLAAPEEAAAASRLPVRAPAEGSPPDRTGSVRSSSRSRWRLWRSMPYARR